MSIDVGELAAARQPTETIPIDEIDVVDLDLWRTATMHAYFARRRRDDPVHHHPASPHPDGVFWSITTFEDLVAIEADHKAFSSRPTITLNEPIQGFNPPMFIAMDPPSHGEQHKIVSPKLSPANGALGPHDDPVYEVVAMDARGDAGLSVDIPAAALHTSGGRA